MLVLLLIKVFINWYIKITNILAFKAKFVGIEVEYQNYI